MWRIGTNYSHVRRIGTKSSHLWKLVSKLTRVKNWYQIFTQCKKLVPNYHRCEELVLNRHRYQWQTVNNLNRMQNAAFFCVWGGVILSMWEIRTHVCYMKSDFVRIFTKYIANWYLQFSRDVRNWYQFFTVSNLRSVKFAVQQSYPIQVINCPVYTSNMHRLHVDLSDQCNINF